MYRTVLVPLDGSPFGEHALPLAVNIARRAGARLRLVLVHTAVGSLYNRRDMIPDISLDAILRKQEAAYLEDVANRLEEHAPTPVSSTLVDGPVVDAVYQQCIADAADLVVMATHGRGGLSRFWLGSVADALVRQLPMPILLVRPQEGPPDLTRDQVFQRIMVPLDGSELAEQGLGPAVALGTLMDADYLLVRVVDPLQAAGRDVAGSPISGLVAEGRKRLLEEATAYLDRIAERLRGQSLRVLTRTIVSFQAAEAILDQAGASPKNLIALTTHGRRGLVRLLLGSVADKVIRGTSTPVLVYRPVADPR